MFRGWLFCVVCMNVAALVSGCFSRNKKVGRLRSYLSWVMCSTVVVEGLESKRAKNGYVS
jgi:hypothetical protein